MIGRKRTRQLRRSRPGHSVPLAARLDREVDHHDPVLLDQPDQHDHADEGIDVQILLENQQGEERPNPADGNPDRIVSGWMKLS